MGQTQRMEFNADDDLAAGLRAVADDRKTTIANVLRVAARTVVGDEPSPYFRIGAPYSFIRDAWASDHDFGPAAEDARGRLAKFTRMQQDRMTVALSAIAAGTFATATTGNAGQVIPPGYRSSPFVSSSITDRPLFAASEQGILTDGTPFTVPGTITDAVVDAAVGTHTEAANRADGTLTIGSATIQPGSIEGLYRVTRELIDSSNPAIDQVALSVMAESYRRQTEQRIFTELNTVQSGVITAGLVPSGAQARLSAGAALPADLRKAILNYVDFAKRKATHVVASSRASVSDTLESLDMQAYALRDVTVDLSAWVNGTAAGDADVLVIGPDTLWTWASPVLELRYFERQGPGMIDLALWGYFATKALRPVGISSIRHT